MKPLLIRVTVSPEEPPERVKPEPPVVVEYK
jgi:hypothetical protein